MFKEKQEQGNEWKERICETQKNKKRKKCKKRENGDGNELNVMKQRKKEDGV